jgi:hypothetical protein
MAALGREPVSPLASTLPLAHTGHVLIDLAIYAVPVIMVAAWLKVSSWRDKRAATRGSPARRPPDDQR